MILIIFLLIGAAHVVIGVLLLLRLDNSRRHYAILDRLSLFQQLFCCLTWPIALPLLMWRPGHD